MQYNKYIIWSFLNLYHIFKQRGHLLHCRAKYLIYLYRQTNSHKTGTSSSHIVSFPGNWWSSVLASTYPQHDWCWGGGGGGGGGSGFARL